MRGWGEDSIGELVRPAVTWTPSQSQRDDRFNYIDLSAVDQNAKSIVGARELPCSDAPSRARQLVAEGDVLVSTVRPNLNGVARVPASLDGATASTGFCVLRPRPDRLCGRFLFHWVKTPGFVADMVRKATGASYPAVSDRIILESRVPVPPLPEQRRIAGVLDRAEALRAKRRATLAQLETLTQSIFLDMFGDPATNPKAWPRKALGEIGEVITGNTPPRAIPAYYGGAIEWIKSDNINTPHYYLTKAEEGLSELGREVARTAPAGSILVTCIAGTPACIGNAAMTDRQVAFNQQINALVPKQGDVNFIYVQMLVGKRLIQQASTAGMKGMVSKSRFERVSLMFPPVDLQRGFASRAKTVEELKTAHRVSLAEMDALFAALQHRAFRGEL